MKRSDYTLSSIIEKHSDWKIKNNPTPLEDRIRVKCQIISMKSILMQHLMKLEI